MIDGDNKGQAMACESDKCEKYGLHHDYEDGVEVRKCFACENDYLRCNSCVESEHEGQFCRCEERNIRIAKEMRSRGESPWTKSQPERLNEKTNCYKCNFPLIPDERCGNCLLGKALN
jgi:hypothetical protein